VGNRLAHPVRALRLLGGVVRDAFLVLRSEPAPSTSFNREVKAGRGFRVLSLGLDTVRSAAHERGGKVNDAVLAIVSGGIRELLVSRGEAVDGLALQVSVPVAGRDAADARELGNRAGALRIPLPVGEPDPGRRLVETAARSRAAKQKQQPNLASAAVAWLAILGLARPFIARQRLINVFVTNVPGPPVPIYVLGARVLDAFPITAIAGNAPLCFAAFSYCGRFSLVTIVDPSLAGEVDIIQSGLARAWAGIAAEGDTLPGETQLGDGEREPVGTGLSSR